MFHFCFLFPVIITKFGVFHKPSPAGLLAEQPKHLLIKPFALKYFSISMHIYASKAQITKRISSG